MQTMSRKQRVLIGFWFSTGTLGMFGCDAEPPPSVDDDEASETEEVDEPDAVKEFVSIDCDAWQDDPPEPMGCVNQPIYCNDEIESTTFGATSRLGDDFYLQSGVTPRGQAYQDAGDVVYELLLPGDTDVVLSLDTPCADLDLFAMNYRHGSQRCPSATTQFKESDFSQRRSDLEELNISTGTLSREDSMQGGRSYLVVIDGKEGQHGSYRLTVDCSDNRSQNEVPLATPTQPEPVVSETNVSDPQRASDTNKVVEAQPKAETKPQSPTNATTESMPSVPSQGGLILNVEAPYQL